MVSRILAGLNSQNTNKKIPYESLIGCNKLELYEHLLKLMPDTIKIEDYPPRSYTSNSEFQS
jgi:hypothetical protein